MFLCPCSDLRVFPERYVVCVRCPEDASAHHGNLSLATVSAVYALSISSSSHLAKKVLHGSVCYYGECDAKLSSHFIYTNPLYVEHGRGDLLTRQGLLVREEERKAGGGVT